VTIQDASERLWKLAGSDLFVLAKPNGRVVALHMTGPGWSPDTAEQDLKRSLDLGEDASWWYNDGRLYWVFLRPIIAGSGSTALRMGTLALGYQVDSTVAQQLATAAGKGSKGLVGFHGAGGGGSMMSMDAIVNAGFTIANFTDTSGNPSASKVYRAARIILAQPDLIGYFGLGSGVASQEQYWSAYGLAKAFWELDLDIPAVIRLGGNTEDRAVDILRRMSELLRAPVEGYRKTDTPAFIAARFAEMVAGAGGKKKWNPRTPRAPKFVKDPSATKLAVKNGCVWIDTARWSEIRAAVETHSGGLIIDRDGAPAAALPNEEFATKDSELLACDVECRLAGIESFYLELDVPGLDELIGGGG